VRTCTASRSGLHEQQLNELAHPLVGITKFVEQKIYYSHSAV
jgi:hypothetical protein